MRAKRLPGLAVLAVNSGTAVGTVRRTVIDPQRRQVAALLVAQPRSLAKKFLPIEAVRSIGSHAVTVNSEEALVPPREDSYLSSLLTQARISLFGTPVVTAGGHLVGVVSDFEIGEGGAISRLFIREGLWSSLAGKEREIQGDQLLALGKDAAIVTDASFERPKDELKAPGGEAAAKPRGALSWRWLSKRTGARETGTARKEPFTADEESL